MNSLEYWVPNIISLAVVFSGNGECLPDESFSAVELSAVALIIAFMKWIPVVFPLVLLISSYNYLTFTVLMFHLAFVTRGAVLDCVFDADAVALLMFINTTICSLGWVARISKIEHYVPV
jgi:hypothetical protein